MATGALLAAMFGYLVIWLNTNQYATGLASVLFAAAFGASGINMCRKNRLSKPTCHSGIG